MTYYLKRTDGTPLVTLADRTMNSAVVPLTLIGRGVVNYGTQVSENFVRLLENFANGEPPSNPMSGQLWYNSSSQTLHLRRGSVWKELASTDYVNQAFQNAIASQQPITLAGDVLGSGTTNSTITATLSASGVTPGTYTKTVVDAKGRVTMGQSLTATDIKEILGYRPAEPGEAQAASVRSVNNMGGDVMLTVSDIPGAAPLNSPAFTGTPTIAAQSASAGGRLTLLGFTGQSSAALDTTNSVFRIFRASDGANVLRYDLNSGSLTVPADITGRNITSTVDVIAQNSLLSLGGAAYVRSKSGSNRSLIFQNSAGANTGGVTQLANNNLILISTQSDWSKPITVDTSGSLTAASHLSATMNVYSHNGTFVARSSGPRRLVFENADGTMEGSINQDANGAIILYPNATGNAYAHLDRNGNFVVTGNTYTLNGNHSLRSYGNSNLWFQRGDGLVNNAVIYWNNSNATLRLSARGDGGQPISVNSLGDLTAPGWVYSHGFCFMDEPGIPDTGIFQERDGSWIMTANDKIRGRINYEEVVFFFTYTNYCTFALQHDGNVVYTQGGVPKWNVWSYLSDERHKENIADWSGSGLDVVRKLRVASFDWKSEEDASGGSRTGNVGFIAQEVEQVVPAAVKTIKDTKLLRKEELVPYLTRAVQELSAENDALRKRVAALEAKLDAILAKLG